MSYLYKEILPLLELLGREIKILPAVGGAIEELQHPDQDEVDDNIVNKDLRLVDAFHEFPEPLPRAFYRPTPPLYRRDKHLFRFFIDGSIKTYFLGTGIEADRSFPIELSQIGAAVIKREANGTLKVLENKREILLLLPKYGGGISDTLWDKINELEKPEWLKIVDFTLPDPFSDSKKDPRDKAGAKARSEMHRMEIDLIKTTDSHRNEDSWLIIDGSVKFIEKEIWDHWANNPGPYIIGVAKSFKKDVVFKFGRRTQEHKDITNLLAELPHCHRTAVFKASEDGKVAFWYVRIREQREVDYPLMGVVKVEIPRPDGSPVPTELADLISRALVAERNVTPYGADRRWHNSLYPIYIAEQVIKNSFFSKEVILGSIRWTNFLSLRR